uniref:Putative secreted peptide n=1 Tax=Hyalomma excavatum TaxID=257692 RepID=A0A131XHS8_9ACAR
MSIKLQWCYALVMMTYSGLLFVSGSIERHVRKMLDSEVPLVLLWANERPSSSGEECWLSEYYAYAPTGYSRYMYRGAADKPPTKPENKDDRNKALLELSVYSSGGQVKLKAHVGSGSMPKIGGEDTEYTILYADTTCFILLLPEKLKASPVSCVAWVPAHTAHFMHTACRGAFVRLCPACKKTTEEPAEA